MCVFKFPPASPPTLNFKLNDSNLNVRLGCCATCTARGRYVPRSLFIDLDGDNIDDVRSSDMRELFHPRYLLSGKESAADNFARGCYGNQRSDGSETMIAAAVDRIRQCTDNCERLQGFIITHSVAGGTGSGFTARLCQQLSDDYAKSVKMAISVFPNFNGTSTGQSTVAAYNAAFATRELMQSVDTTIALDNAAITKLCRLQMVCHSSRLTGRLRL